MNRIPWYDPSSHVAVCPARTDGADDLIVKLHQIGAEVLDELALPVDMGMRLFRVKLPEWLKLSEYCEGDYYFNDAKKRMRMFIDVTDSRSVELPTRYHATYWSNGENVPAAHDSEDGKRLWRYEGIGEEQDGYIAAEAWLDANYPDWRNPMAYWSE